MTHQAPPQIAAAAEQFSQQIKALEGDHVDPMTSAFGDIESGVAKMLGGAFNPQSQEHGLVAFLVGATLAQRMSKELGAFWFMNRGAPNGAAMGLPDAMAVVSPIEAATTALMMSKLGHLDELLKGLKNAGAQARLGIESAATPPQNLGPQDYQRIFDPGLVQLAHIDGKALAEVLKKKPNAIRLEIEDALGRAQQLPAPVKEQMRGQICGSLKQLPDDRAMGDFVTDVPQLVELVAWLFSARGFTGIGSEELWRDLALPLLHVGAAEKFPELDEDDIQELPDDVDPLLVYVEEMPFQTPAADEDGLLGVFPLDTAKPLLDVAGLPHLIEVSPDAIAKPMADFDPKAVKAAIEKFATHLKEAGGKPGAGGSRMMDATMTVLANLADVYSAVKKDANGKLCVRRTTEAEASSEAAIGILRAALTGPRIILV